MARGTGIDLRSIIQHPLFLLTLLTSIAGWWTAFIGQIVFEAKCNSSLRIPSLSQALGAAVPAN